jgi:hypothetical protein
VNAIGLEPAELGLFLTEPDERSVVPVAADHEPGGAGMSGIMSPEPISNASNLLLDAINLVVKAFDSLGQNVKGGSETHAQSE